MGDCGKVSDIISLLERAVVSAFSWAKNRKVQAYFILISVLHFLSAALNYSIVGAVGFWALFFEGAGPNVYSSGSLAAYTWSFLGLFLPSFAAFLVIDFLYLKALAAGLGAAGFAERKIGLKEYAEVIFLSILFAFYTLFSWLNPRFLYLLLAGLVSGALSVAGGVYGVPAVSFVFGILSAALFSAYLVIIAYNMVRLGFAPFFYLSGASTKRESLQKSWAALEGSVITVFAALVLTGFLLGTFWAAAFAVASRALDALFYTSAYKQYFSFAVNAVLQPALVFSMLFGTISIFTGFARPGNEKVKSTGKPAPRRKERRERPNRRSRR